ncbi:MAG: hypothetical protein PHG19_03010 [Anaerotignum sp.]|nr:hypothetical protein [Anaerotignum sp.]
MTGKDKYILMTAKDREKASLLEYLFCGSGLVSLLKKFPPKMYLRWQTVVAAISICYNNGKIMNILQIGVKYEK